MFKKLVSKIVGDPNKKVIDGLMPIVRQVNEREPALMGMSDDELRAETAVLKQRVADGETLEDVTPEAYALVREASRRTTGMRHYDVQIIGGTLLNSGDVVEMRTGEGKTLVATLPLFLNALSGKGAHLVTVNEYLARRDGGWMGQIFHFLDLSVGCIGPQKFSALFDPNYVNPNAELEDERLVHWRPSTRKQAYEADITYGISSEFGFDYLRDNMSKDKEKLVQRDLNFAVIDEVDNVLIDEARTPLIISGLASRSGTEYTRFAGYVRNLSRNTAEEDEDPNGDYDLDEKSRSIVLTDIGIGKIEDRIPEIDAEAGDSLYEPRFFELTYYLDNALRAQYMFKKDVEYVVQGNEVVIVDDFTGRMMPGRRYSDGLHEAIEAKEGVSVQRETTTVATITLQNYFRLYESLAGMTGTALTDAEEFDKIYELGVTPLPTNVQYIVDQGDRGLIEHKDKVEGDTRISYLDPDTKIPTFYKRLDHKDQVYGTESAKDVAIVNEVARVYEMGRPILVGTTSVEHSEIIHKMLKKKDVPHTVLNAKMKQSEALVVAQAGRKGAVTISTNMAGRGTDILLGGNPEGMTAVFLEESLFDRPLLSKLAFTLLEEGESAANALVNRHPKLSPELLAWLKELQTEYDDALAEIEEVQIVGYLARTLQEPYDIDYNSLLELLKFVHANQLTEAREYLEKIGKDTALADDATRLWALYGRYQAVSKDSRQKAQFLGETLFDKHYNARAALSRAVLGGEIEEAHTLTKTIPALPASLIDSIQKIEADAEIEQRVVWDLGGLHVVGSERHESRRIDNQLRGRAARQGDPGSSRFFLSLEDDLMLRFGGERLKGFMSRTQIPDDMPIENKMLDRIIESSQERIEGYNFDMRKNVVEYDDVMTMQRQAIYRERRSILMGEEFDLDAKVEESFADSIEELVDNYIDNYHLFARSEIDTAIDQFSTEATDTINISGIIARLRGLLPGITALDRDELEALPTDKLPDHLMRLVYENEASGQNLNQLLQAMGRFVPLLTPAPNLAVLASKRSGQLQTREAYKRGYLAQIEPFFDDFLSEQMEKEDRDRIWEKAVTALKAAFDSFSVDGLTASIAERRQAQFRLNANDVLNTLLLDSLSTLDGEHLTLALKAYVNKQQAEWRKRIGEDEYAAFQRLLLLEAIDREWRDYLTAMDDLRREIGLESIAQRDPKIEYKRRSFEMFEDMRHNIEKDVANRFFRQLQSHQAYVKRQRAEEVYKLQAQQAGYQQVARKKGKGAELRRDAPKVGRNDPCPCGSGKKYKACHGRAGSGASVPAAGATAGAAATRRKPSRSKKTNKRKKRRR